MFKPDNPGISLYSISKFRDDNKTINPFLVVIEEYKTRNENILNNIKALNDAYRIFNGKYTSIRYKNSSMKYITKLYYTKYYSASKLYKKGAILTRKGLGYLKEFIN